MRGAVGTTDRVIRVAVGVIALGVGLTHAGGISATWGYIADAIGVIGLGTGLVARCPLYGLFGVHTSRKPA
jgi:hypothetical protein